ncbi:fasciclin domain-containing protein [Kitasatospora sp. NA04385]|uniref:fasciclin domain-containing protein n=1 Tax=Kitasatospora sp. NA04385 TaxID=2742135 RepID=UPI00158FE6FC|nr:fasciclin domain-containing protein [Kitasatospora sp. NA04385]QKW18065.1 fasciclin domain-containing protein [Kitasatospora sp. NA04385]
MRISLLRSRPFAALLAAGSLALTLGACSSSGSATDSASQAASSPAAMSSAAVSPATIADQPFGAACAAVPKDGAGSFTGMAKDPVATAASNNPLLSTLVTAVKQAGLVDTLNSAQNITVFAPTNDAFAKLPKADLDALLADKAKLTKVLTYHVSPDRLSPAALPGKHPSLEGADLTAGGSGQDFTVNDGAKVLCGNVQTANATVYIVDTVLMPAS